MSVPPVEIGPRAARHALSRFGFGPRPGDISRVLDQGIESWLSEQLSPGADPETDSRLRGLTTLGYSVAQVIAQYEQDQRTFPPVVDELQTARLVRAAHSRNQLFEVMVDFWFNHFNVSLTDTPARFALPAYERDVIRPHAMGRFRDLIGAVAAHPAMLYYLDNYLNRTNRTVAGNVVVGLNENYGRELLELHTVGVDAGYTQADVIGAARAFTGWTVDLRGQGGFVFRAVDHDRDAKSVFGLSLPAGGGVEDGNRLLDYLSEHPATARFIARRLCERFISDDPPAAAVERVATRYLSSGGDIPETVKAVAQSPEFWAEAFGPGKVKKPYEYVVSVVRAAGAQVTTARGIVGSLASMGEALFTCVPPTGYSNRGVDWLNPSAQLARMNFALDVAAGAVPGVSPDARSLASASGVSTDDPRAFASAISEQVFGKALSAETLAAAGGVTPGGPVSVGTRVLGLCLASPEMQVR